MEEEKKREKEIREKEEGGKKKNKEKNNIFPTKIDIVKLWFFPVVMCRCESWTMDHKEG